MANPGAEFVAAVARGLEINPALLLGEKITTEDVLAWVKAHSLTDQERTLIEAFRAMGPLEALGTLSFVTRDPAAQRAFEEALKKVSNGERAELARRFDRGSGARDEGE